MVTQKISLESSLSAYRRCAARGRDHPDGIGMRYMTHVKANYPDSSQSHQAHLNMLQ